MLRIEDLDPERARDEWVSGLRQDLEWFGLDWDETVRQSDCSEAHADALDRLEGAGLLYACTCTRRELRMHAERAPDGSVRYPGTCRTRVLSGGEWRRFGGAVRLRLSPGELDPRDESGHATPGDPSTLYGDPVVRRRDGSVAYQLASVVDDAVAGVSRVVRGRDLAPSTLVQIALQQLLEYPRPSYRHHLLLLEGSRGKLAKLHGAVSVPTLRSVVSSAQVCGFLASLIGLVSSAAVCRPRDLVREFDWARVEDRDRLVAWDGSSLVVLPDSVSA